MFFSLNNKFSILFQKLGKLYISTCLEKDARRLTINLVKADDLPKWGISGPPGKQKQKCSATYSLILDVCIRITLTQAGTTQTKQSRVLKNTCSAKYRCVYRVSRTKMGARENMVQGDRQ
jgi:hypothetical protein